MSIIKGIFAKLRNKDGLKIPPGLSVHPSFVTPKNSVFSGNIKFGKYSTLGTNSFFRGNISVGNYCQFGAYVSMHSRNHPSNYLTIYNNRRLFNGKLKELLIDDPVVIGNDVWLGHGVTVLGGVTIGNGAIIGAGSVVTKDIPNFAIAVGVPAKVIKYRFSSDMQKQISALEWWKRDIDELKDLEGLFFKDLSKIEDINTL